MTFTLKNWKVTSPNPKTRRIKCFLLRKWRSTKDLLANRFGFIEESPTWLSLAETTDSLLPYTSPIFMTDVKKSGKWGEIISTCRILKSKSLTILKSWLKYWTNRESSTQSNRVTVLTKSSKKCVQTWNLTKFWETLSSYMKSQTISTKELFCLSSWWLKGKVLLRWIRNKGESSGTFSWHLVLLNLMDLNTSLM